MKKLRKPLALLLCALMIVTLLPVTSFAEEPAQDEDMWSELIAGDHVHEFAEQTIPGNCVTREKTVKVCAVCGLTRTVREGDFGDHGTLTFVESVPGSCTRYPAQVYRCELCGETVTEYDYNSDQYGRGHRHADGAQPTSSRAPTCTENGYEYYVCEVCGNSYSVTLWSTGHSHAADDPGVTVAPTCETPGYTEYVCTKCGETYRTDEKYSSHQYESSPHDCGMPYCMVQTCKYCGDVKDVDCLAFCGDDLTWRVADGTLTISGTGDMWTWDEGNQNKYPGWTGYLVEMPARMEYDRIVVEEGCTSISLYFYELAYLTVGTVTEIVLPDTLERIDPMALMGFTALESLELPASVSSVGGYLYEGIEEDLPDLCAYNIPAVTFGNKDLPLEVGEFYFAAVKDAELSALQNLYTDLNFRIMILGGADKASLQEMLETYENSGYTEEALEAAIENERAGIRADYEPYILQAEEMLSFLEKVYANHHYDYRTELSLYSEYTRSTLQPYADAMDGQGTSAWDLLMEYRGETSEEEWFRGYVNAYETRKASLQSEMEARLAKLEESRAASMQMVTVYRNAAENFRRVIARMGDYNSLQEIRSAYLALFAQKQQEYGGNAFIGGTVCGYGNARRWVEGMNAAYGTTYEFVSLCDHPECEEVGEKAATCTEDGYTGDLVCAICGDVVEAGSVIPATGHTDADGDDLCDVCGADLTLIFDVSTADGTRYVLTTDGTLTISGSGEAVYDARIESDKAVKKTLRQNITWVKNVVVEEGITGFIGYLSDTVYTIPIFEDLDYCPTLESIDYPASFDDREISPYYAPHFTKATFRNKDREYVGLSTLINQYDISCTEAEYCDLIVKKLLADVAAPGQEYDAAEQTYQDALAALGASDLEDLFVNSASELRSPFTVYGYSNAKNVVDMYNGYFSGSDVQFVSLCPHTHTTTRNYPADCTHVGLTGIVFCEDCGDMTEYGEIVPYLQHTDVAPDGKDGRCDVCGTDMIECVGVSDTITCTIDYEKETLTFDGTGTLPTVNLWIEDENGNRQPAPRTEWVGNENIFNYIKHIVFGEGIESIGESTPDALQYFVMLEDVTVLNPAFSFGNAQLGYTIFSSEAAKQDFIQAVFAFGDNEKTDFYDEEYQALLEKSLMRLEQKLLASDNEVARYMINGETSFDYKLSGFTVYGPTESTARTYAEENGFRFCGLDCDHAESAHTGQVDATCTTDGYSGDIVCTACGYVLAEGIAIPATGHTDADGDDFCDVCGKDLGWTFDLTAADGTRYVLTTDGTLTISGSGVSVSDEALPADNAVAVALYDNLFRIRRIVIEEGIMDFAERQDEEGHYHSHLISYLSHCVNLESVSYPSTFLHRTEISPYYAPSFTEVTIRSKTASMPGATSVMERYELACTEAEYLDVLSKYMAAMRLMREVPSGTTTSDPETVAAVRAYQDACAALGVSDFGELVKPCSPKARSPFTVYGYGNAKQTVTNVNSYLNGDVRFVSLCTHTETEEISYPAACDRVGFTACEVCKDCGEILAAGDMLPILSHTDADGDHLCDACGAATLVSGSLSETVTWSADLVAHTLTIDGAGALPTLSKDPDGPFAPWSDYFNNGAFWSMTLGAGITSLGENDADTLNLINLSGLTVLNPALSPAGSKLGYSPFSGTSISDYLTLEEVGRSMDADGTDATYQELCTRALLDLMGRLPQDVLEKIGAESLDWPFDYPIPGFTVYGYADSAAETYANENGFTFVALGEDCAHANTEVRGQTDATCTTDGYTGDTYCADCGALLEQGEAIPAAHTPRTETQPATCEEDGYVRVTCAVCGTTLHNQTLEKTGHLWDEWIYWDEDTHIRLCMNDDSHEQIMPHVWEKTGETPATCAAKGEIVYTCADCLEEKTEETEQLPHTVETIPAAPATCTEGGFTAGEKCGACGEILVAPTATEKLGHDYVPTVTKEATCAEAGETSYTCSRCGDSYTEPIEKLPHTPEEIPAVPAICTEGGFTAGSKCKNCGEILVAPAPTEKLGHDYVAVVTDPTCTAGGYTTHTCSRCGDSYVTDVTDPAGHVWDDGTALKAATCTQTGSVLYVCTVCGEERTDTIPLAAHTPTAVEAADATCTATGRLAHYRCTVCGALFLDAAGHTPTTEADVTIPAKGHQPVTETVPATCTENGHVSVTCSVCHAEIHYQTLEKTGHAWGEWQYLDADTHIRFCDNDAAHEDTADHSWTKTGETPATCSAKGEIVYTCDVCQGEKTEETEKLPHTPEALPAVPATCTAGGLTAGSKCKVCGEILVPQAETERLGHVYVPAVTKEASCTEDGVTTYTCSRCGDSYTEPIAKTGHHYVSAVTKEASCTEEGVTTYTCSDCGDSYTEPIAKKAHTPTAVEAADATCTATGLLAHYRCTVCGALFLDAAGQTPATEADVTVPAKGHQPVTETVPATCEADGYVSVTCSVCGATIHYQTLEKTGHAWGEWQYLDEDTHIRFCDNDADHEDTADHNWELTDETPATCSAKGERVYVCADCLEEKTEELDKLPHTPEEIPAVAATCTAGGKTAGSKCKVCGEILVPQSDTEKLGHNYVPSVTKEATCAEAGVTTYTCSRCGDSYTEPINKLPHTPEEIPAVAATCSATGLTAGSKCKVCGEILVPQTVTEKLPHTPTTVLTAATCTTPGELRELCAVCGQQISVTPLPINETAHSWGAWTRLNDAQHTRVCANDPAHTETADHRWNSGRVTKKATCAETGEKVFTCVTCKATRTETMEKLAHTPEEIPAVAATCTAGGKTAGSKCKVCGEILVPQSDTEKLGHNYTAAVTKAANCKEAGVTTFTCTRCGDSYTEPIDKLAHTPEEIPAVAATCTAEGLTAGSRCKVCGEILVRQNVVPKTAHTYQAEVTAAESCTTDGVRTFTCSVCGDSYTETITRKGHLMVRTEARAAACETAGNVAYYTCARCGGTFLDEAGERAVSAAEITVPAKGHTEVETVKAASCLEAGERKVVCSVCGKMTAYEILPPAGRHDWGAWTKLDDAQHVRVCKNDASHTETANHRWNAGKVTQKATCTADGVKTFTCLNCKATRTEAIPAAGHQYGAWTVTRASTLRDAGEKARTCSACGNKETEALPLQEGTVTTDEDTGISVAYTGESYEEEVRVVAERTYEGAKFMTLSYGKVDFWDIKTVRGEEEVQPEAPVLVSIPLPEGYDPASIEIYHIDSVTGVREYVQNVKVENGMITFFAGGFSIYIVVDTRTEGETFPDDAYLLGDVDLDGKIDAADARLALRRAVNLETFAETPAANLSADVDFSDSVTAADARKILRAAVSLESPADWKKN